MQESVAPGQTTRVNQIVVSRNGERRMHIHCIGRLANIETTGRITTASTAGLSIKR